MSSWFDSISVLDRGHVRLLGFMGCDASIASDARASTGRDALPPDPAKDRGLIRRLMRDEHTSPFEMAELKFHVKAPIYVARQWFRTRMASYSERSGRYTELPPDEFQRTAPNAWRFQSKDNKQGSEGMLDEDIFGEIDGNELSDGEEQVLVLAQDQYRVRLGAGIAREQARKDLPLSAYTEWVWKIDLHNLLHFLRLRLAPDAQLEIRQYAQAIAGVVEQLFPATWEAFVDHRLEAMTLSRAESETFRVAVSILNDEELRNEGLVNFHVAKLINANFPGDRERAACRVKLARLGLVAAEGGAA